MSKRTAFTFLVAAIAGEFVSAQSGALALSAVDQDGIPAQLPDVPEQPYYPDGYRALRLAAATVEQEGSEPAPQTGGPGTEAAPAGASAAARRRATEAAPTAGRTHAVPFTANRLPARPVPFFLIPCGWGPELTASEPAEAALEYTARRVAYVDHRLRAQGYPPGMFEGLIRDYEGSMLRLALAPPPSDGNAVSQLRLRLDPLDERLVRNLEARRIRQGGSLPPVTLRHGCITRDIPYAPSIVRTSPANGRVWFIPAFRFHVCSNTPNGPDPWNLEQCSGWREVHPDQESALVGRQKYQARWRDGATGRGDRTFEARGTRAVLVEVRRD